MYTLSLRVKKNGVPILSKAQIDAIGEHFVQDFQPEVLTNPAPWTLKDLSNSTSE